MILSNQLIANHMSSVATHKRDVAQEILRTIAALKLGSGFGSVKIVLHEGRVSQIEKRDKLRFT
jgi:hypothetical protein